MSKPEIFVTFRVTQEEKDLAFTLLRTGSQEPNRSIERVDSLFESENQKAVLEARGFQPKFLITASLSK